MASFGMKLVWRRAVAEAIRAKHECVEPEHFLEALTKGRDFCRELVMWMAD